MSWRSGLTVERSPSDIVCRYVGVADVRLGVRVNTLKLSAALTKCIKEKLILIDECLRSVIAPTQSLLHRLNATSQIASILPYSP